MGRATRNPLPALALGIIAALDPSYLLHGGGLQIGSVEGDLEGDFT